jgi:hypothetical protein
MEEETDKKRKVIRYGVWTVVILSFTLYSAIKAPEHSLEFIKGMLIEVIQMLIVG